MSVYLQFISIQDDGNSIIGAASMTDRHWTGSIRYYNDHSNYNIDNSAVTIKIDSGASCGAFLDHERFIVGEDSGNLQIFEKCDNTDSIPEMHSIANACQHDDGLVSLSVFSDKSHTVTGGMDYCIKIWNVSELLSVNTFQFAHTNIVTSVDTKPNSNSTFVSTSLDQEALIWDIRLPLPAYSVLKKNCGLTTSTWNIQAENILAIGAEDGHISIIDIRQANEVVWEIPILDRPLNKILYNSNSKKSDEISCCGDNNLVVVVDTKKCKANEIPIIYESSIHKDFVRDLAWHNDYLFTCSWDNTVQKHLP
ncbi:methylosome protein WDR77-like [Prorops nasuta]|uniref:methylosome protein WDR77-like n=1 Tax=Prorops nasuta TaxID=863751 RepID=UPI0034CFA1AF